MPGGRPRKEIDREQFEKLCAIQCTEQELYAWFDVTDKTLRSWCRREYGRGFSEVYREKRDGGKISLRRAQWQLAHKNAAMAIWLGKQYLDQREPEAKDSGDTLERLDAVLKAVRAEGDKAQPDAGQIGSAEGTDGCS